MSTLSDLLAEHTSLPGSAVAHLQSLVSEWQLLADLSFSDLCLWVRPETDDPAASFVCVAQVRPTTGATVHPDDMVGHELAGTEAHLLAEAWSGPCIVTEIPPPAPPRPDEEPATFPPGSVARTYRQEVVPVCLSGAHVALISRDTGSMVGREASLLETAYVDAADDLFQMVLDGTFPPPLHPGEIHTGPRAGDGLLRLDADGRVVYVSPNALSAYHRLNLVGGVLGAELAVVTRRLIADPFDGAELSARITGAVQGRPSLRMEVEVRAATVLFRALPLRPRGRLSGALILVRDVTEVRRRDRALLSKDATIREIHHRVKNNLQTVAALLRLQSRRSDQDAVRHALAESVRRVSAIALVHDMLSTSADDRVDLDQIVDRLVPMIVEVASLQTRARVRREGSFGTLGAELATPLVMVLAELVQNALEHGEPARLEPISAETPARQELPAARPATDAPTPRRRGRTEVVIDVARSAREVRIRVLDDGAGLPEGFSLERGAGLGLQIVRTLVAAELRGTLSVERRIDAEGTEVALTVPLRGRT